MSIMSATTPYTPRHSRTHSPPLSVSSPSTLGPQTQRLNIVTRLAVEGNAKKAENVPIKMYMKVCFLSLTTFSVANLEIRSLLFR